MTVETLAVIQRRYPEIMATGLRTDIGIGWHRIVERFCAEITQSLAGTARMSITELSSKYGTLRLEYRCHGIPKADLDKIRMREWVAECRSSRTCESCGAPGRLRDAPYVFASCDEHSLGKLQLADDFGDFVDWQGDGWYFDTVHNDARRINEAAKST